MKLEKKKTLAQKRRWRIRRKIKGTAERPRLTVCCTNKNIHAQCIDDDAAVTKAAVSSIKMDDVKCNVAGAEVLGAKIAEIAKENGIESVVFDRAGRRYHGMIKAFADAARAGGLKF
ncbi:MAG: 50S ribosomal protein L18 [Opitutales bacterium]|nr:50S ribosomal protein L18 [Opitutales bacterium]NRA26161.1 50S ribosomal protein L18 [Opitutales bacterium]